jgi:hypothetical protein
MLRRIVTDGSGVPTVGPTVIVNTEPSEKVKVQGVNMSDNHLWAIVLAVARTRGD